MEDQGQQVLTLVGSGLDNLESSSTSCSVLAV